MIPNLSANKETVLPTSVNLLQSLLPAMTDDELKRRRRATQAQTRRMFRAKDYEDHTDIDSPVDPVDEDELDAEIDELEAELEEEMAGDDE